MKWIIKIIRLIADWLERRNVKIVQDYKKWRAEYVLRKAIRARIAGADDNPADKLPKDGTNSEG